MSARRKAQRRLEIAALVEEGRAAHAAGKPRETVRRLYPPHHTVNGAHWLKGWDAEQAQLEAQEDDNASDLAIAIGKHAFRAGFTACARWLEPQYSDVDPSAAGLAEIARAWSDYTPPEELCGRDFK